MTERKCVWLDKNQFSELIQEMVDCPNMNKFEAIKNFIRERLEEEIVEYKKDAELYREIKRGHEIPWGVETPHSITGRLYVMYGEEPIGCLEGELDEFVSTIAEKRKE